MNELGPIDELDLPDAPPLPDDVRARVATQLPDRLDARRSRLPLLAAALVVLALVASTVVALGGIGGERPLSSAARPAPTGNAAVDNALERCAAAVDASPDRAAWPATITWRTTDVLLAQTPGSGETDIAIAINDAFACYASASDVSVTATAGPAVGPVQAVRLAPALVVLLDPGGQTLQIVPEAAVVQRFGRPDAPVQMISISPASDLRLVVGGRDVGPLPEPAPVGMIAQDRPSLSRAPEPPGTSLADCLASALPGARTLVTHPGTPAAVAGTADDRYAGLCVDGPQGPVFRGADIPAGTAARVVIAPSPAAIGTTAVLLAVPDSVTRAEIATAAGPGTACTLGSGFALCTLATPDPVTVTVHAGATATPLTIP